jgi:hypothetical protein
LRCEISINKVLKKRKVWVRSIFLNPGDS